MKATKGVGGEEGSVSEKRNQPGATKKGAPTAPAVQQKG